MSRSKLTLGALAFGFFLQLPGAAVADGASDGSNPYDGQDPAATGCNVDAYEIGSSPIVDRATNQQVSTIHIYYSRSCSTNWISVDSNPYGGATTKNIQSALGGWSSERDVGTGSSYSMMVYAPGDTAVEGYVDLFAPGVEEWTQEAEGYFSY